MCQIIKKIYYFNFYVNYYIIFLTGVAAMGCDPFESSPTIIILHRDMVFRCATVVDGEDDRRGHGREAIEMAVDDGGGRREYAEAAAAKVEDEGELCAIRVDIDRRKIDAGGDIGGNADILGVDVSEGVKAGRRLLLRLEPLDRAVFVDEKVRRVVIDHRVVVRCHSTYSRKQR